MPIISHKIELKNRGRFLAGFSRGFKSIKNVGSSPKGNLGNITSANPRLENGAPICPATLLQNMPSASKGKVSVVTS